MSDGTDDERQDRAFVQLVERMALEGLRAPYLKAAETLAARMNVDKPTGWDDVSPRTLANVLALAGLVFGEDRVRVALERLTKTDA
jgi:hypothetical protein